MVLAPSHIPSPSQFPEVPTPDVKDTLYSTLSSVNIRCSIFLAEVSSWWSLALKTATPKHTNFNSKPRMSVRRVGQPE